MDSLTALGHVAVCSMFRGHPLLRIVWAFVSHWFLDVTVSEHFPKDLHLTDARTWDKHKGWMFWQVFGMVLFWVLTRDPWAILLGLLPDVIEAINVGIRLYLGDNVWMKGNLLFPFHRGRKDYLVDLTAEGTHLLEVLLLVVVVILFRGT